MVVKEKRSVKMIGCIQMLGPTGGQQDSIRIVGQTELRLANAWGHHFEFLSNLLSGIGLV
jgi:hypothetical protein